MKSFLVWSAAVIGSSAVVEAFLPGMRPKSYKDEDPYVDEWKRRLMSVYM